MIVNYIARNRVGVPGYVGYDPQEIERAILRMPNMKIDTTEMYRGNDIYLGSACVLIHWIPRLDVTVVSLKIPGEVCPKVFYHVSDMVEAIIQRLEPICPGPDNDRFSH